MVIWLCCCLAQAALNSSEWFFEELLTGLLGDFDRIAIKCN